MNTNSAQKLKMHVCASGRAPPVSSSAPEGTVASAHYRVEEGVISPNYTATSSAVTHRKTTLRMWRRVECLLRLLLLTDVLIALIKSFRILKSSNYFKRLVRALSMNVPKSCTSNDTEAVLLQILFILLFPKLTVVDLAFMPGFSSVAGSAPSGDGSSEACDCQERNGRRPLLSIICTHLPSNLLIPLHFPVFLLFLPPLPSFQLLIRGYMVLWVPSTTPSLQCLSPPLTSLPLPRFSRPLPH